jgi:hypothetical protein
MYICYGDHSEFWFGEEVWGEFHGSLHVSFDFHFSLHEGVLWVKSSFEEVKCVLINESEGCISLALLSFLDGS